MTVWEEANGSMHAATCEVSSVCPSVLTRAMREVVGESGTLSAGTMIQLWASGENSVSTLLLPRFEVLMGSDDGADAG